jgi:CHAP domain
MNTQEFINQYKGTNQDFDNGYGSQCVDLARLAVEKLWGIKSNVVFPANPAVGGAAHAYTDYPNSLINGNSDSVKTIENSIDNCPVEGDIIIWNRNKGGGNGHIALVTEANVNSFTVFEQNNGNGDGYGKDDACKITQYADYTDVLGWLHCTKRDQALTAKHGTVTVSDQTTMEGFINKYKSKYPNLDQLWVRSRQQNGFGAVAEMIMVDYVQPLEVDLTKANADYQILVDKYNILKADKANLQIEKDEAQKQHIESLQVSANNLNQCNNQNANLSNTNKNLEVELAKAPTSTSKPFWQSKKFISTIVLGLIPQIIGFLNPEWRESANQLYSVLIAYLVAQGVVDTTQTLIKK